MFFWENKYPRDQFDIFEQFMNLLKNDYNIFFVCFPGESLNSDNLQEIHASYQG